MAGAATPAWARARVMYLRGCKSAMPVVVAVGLVIGRRCVATEEKRSEIGRDVGGDAEEDQEGIGIVCCVWSGCCQCERRKDV